MKFGELELSLIRECTFKLDGGAMFGVVPKPLWDRLSPADELNRVLLACNLLLIEGPHGRVLVETGMGERWGHKERDRFEIKTLVSSEQVVKEAGLSNDDVDFVVISHLHFDHAGGATRYEGTALIPTFPKAKYLVQKGEWEFAHKANARAQASYRATDFDPLQEHGVLEIVDGDREIVPGIWVHVTGGHTRYHQIVTFESTGRKGIFFADIIPTRTHLPPPWVMGYDHFPLTSCDAKDKWLTLAVQEKYLVVFDHEPGIPWGYVEQKQDGKFNFLPLENEPLAARSVVAGTL
ncbi:MAG: MBL fold metallo-hydrolase [Candidatus Melainabacteria bacterium]|nr:MBL fold metallo-hydrolase [Candidatus Melainabacteria bacterium]